MAGEGEMRLVGRLVFQRHNWYSGVKITHPLHSLEYIGSISIRIITFSDLEVSTTAKSFNCGSKNKSEHMIYESVSSLICHCCNYFEKISNNEFSITRCTFIT